MGNLGDWIVNFFQSWTHSGIANWLNYMLQKNWQAICIFCSWKMSGAALSLGLSAIPHPCSKTWLRISSNPRKWCLPFFLASSWGRHELFLNETIHNVKVPIRTINSCKNPDKGKGTKLVSGLFRSGKVRGALTIDSSEFGHTFKPKSDLNVHQTGPEKRVCW
jgi:hypothetical protein